MAGKPSLPNTLAVGRDMSLTLCPGGEPPDPFPIISQGSITSGIDKIPRALLGASLAREPWRVGVLGKGKEYQAAGPWLSQEVAGWFVG